MKMLLLLILPIANTILTLIDLRARTRAQGIYRFPLPTGVTENNARLQNNAPSTFIEINFKMTAP